MSAYCGAEKLKKILNKQFSIKNYHFFYSFQLAFILVGFFVYPRQNWTNSVTSILSVGAKSVVLLMTAAERHVQYQSSCHTAATLSNSFNQNMIWREQKIRRNYFSYMLWLIFVWLCELYVNKSDEINMFVKCILDIYVYL